MLDYKKSITIWLCILYAYSYYIYFSQTRHLIISFTAQILATLYQQSHCTMKAIHVFTYRLYDDTTKWMSPHNRFRYVYKNISTISPDWFSVGHSYCVLTLTARLQHSLSASPIFIPRVQCGRVRACGHIQSRQSRDVSPWGESRWKWNSRATSNCPC